MAEKRTKKVIFKELLEIDGIKNNTEYTDFINKQIELIDKKNSYKSENKKTKENEEIMNTIVDTLSSFDTKARISEIQDANEILKPLSNQRMSALLKKLVDSNVVVKTIDKKIAYFELA